MPRALLSTGKKKQKKNTSLGQSQRGRPALRIIRRLAKLWSTSSRPTALVPQGFPRMKCQVRRKEQCDRLR